MKVVSGNPAPKHVSTSYVERQNLTMWLTIIGMLKRPLLKTKQTHYPNDCCSDRTVSFFCFRRAAHGQGEQTNKLLVPK